jgi:hypothetical protein
MRPLTVTLPDDSFRAVLSGEKRMIATCRNARKDKYFAAKTTDAARINGRLFRITRITGTPTEWRVFIAP